MQVLKEEVRHNLLRQAADEFLTHGFAKASMRKIALAAGTTIGNVYNYFKNKEELFEGIIKPAYQRMQHLFEHHERATTQEEALHLIRELLEESDGGGRSGLILLIEGSSGTRYEGVRAELVHLLAQHAHVHLERAGIQLSSCQEPFSAVLAESFLQGLVSILKAGMDGERRTQLLLHYIRFYSQGIAGMAS